MMEKPKVIELLGLPNAGKTSHLDALERTLRKSSFKVRCIQDQIKDAPFEDELERNRWAIREVGNLISEAKQGDWDLILVDRGAWAYFASVQALIKNGRHIKGKKKLRKARHALRIALDTVPDEDFFVFIKVSPEISLQRDRQFNVGRVGKIVNPTFLSILGDVYENIIQGRLPPRKKKVIDGEEDFQENQEKLLQAILSLVVPKDKKDKKEVLPHPKLSGKRGGLQWKEETEEREKDVIHV